MILGLIFLKNIRMIKGTCTVILTTCIGDTQHNTQLESDSISTEILCIVFSMLTAWKAEMPNDYYSVFFN